MQGRSVLPLLRSAPRNSQLMLSNVIYLEQDIAARSLKKPPRELAKAKTQGWPARLGFRWCSKSPQRVDSPESPLLSSKRASWWPMGIPIETVWAVRLCRSTLSRGFESRFTRKFCGQSSEPTPPAQECLVLSIHGTRRSLGTPRRLSIPIVQAPKLQALTNARCLLCNENLLLC
jgi:hypothetical protein